MKKKKKKPNEKYRERQTKEKEKEKLKQDGCTTQMGFFGQPRCLWWSHQ